MEGEKLEGDDSEDTLQTVNCVRHFNTAIVLHNVRVTCRADENGPTLSHTRVITHVTQPPVHTHTHTHAHNGTQNTLL